MSRKKDEKSKEELDRELEEGLKETFPASDPPAVTQPTITSRRARSREPFSMTRTRKKR
jgi:hypothetical protein